MRINILDIRHAYASLVINVEQKKKLLTLFKKEGIKCIISRTSIRIARLRRVYNTVSDPSKEEIRRVLSNVQLRTGHSKCIKSSFWVDLTPDLCWLYGVFIGDGNLINVCRFYNTNQAVVQEVNRTVNLYFNTTVKKEPNEELAYFLPKPIKILLEELLGEKGYSIKARIPRILYYLPKNFSSALIRGMFDTDGCCRVGHPPSYSSRSKGLLTDLHSLLKLKFNIDSWILCHDLYIGNKNRLENFFSCLKFYENINFTHSKKRDNLEMSIKSRVLFAILSLVRGGFRYSSDLRDILNRDLSTVIDHLNKLEKLGLIKRKRIEIGINNNLIKYEWYPLWKTS